MACIILQVYDGTFSSSVVLGTYAPQRDQTCWLAKASNLSGVSLSVLRSRSTSYCPPHVRGFGVIYNPHSIHHDE